MDASGNRIDDGIEGGIENEVENARARASAGGWQRAHEELLRLAEQSSDGMPSASPRGGGRP